MEADLLEGALAWGPVQPRQGRKKTKRRFLAPREAEGAFLAAMVDLPGLLSREPSIDFEAWRRVSLAVAACLEWAF